MFDKVFDGQVSNYGRGVVEGAACCGSRVRKTVDKVDLKRSNFINFKAVKSDPYKSQDGKKEVVCIETKVGPLTIGMRYEW